MVSTQTAGVGIKRIFLCCVYAGHTHSSTYSHQIWQSNPTRVKKINKGFDIDSINSVTRIFLEIYSHSSTLASNFLSNVVLDQAYPGNARKTSCVVTLSKIGLD